MGQSIVTGGTVPFQAQVGTVVGGMVSFLAEVGIGVGHMAVEVVDIED